MAAHRLPDVTVVADAGMISEAKQKAIEAASLSFIVGMKIPHVPLCGRNGGASTPAASRQPGEDGSGSRHKHAVWCLGPYPGSAGRWRVSFYTRCSPGSPPPSTFVGWGLAPQLFLDLGLDGRGVVAGAWP